MGAAAAELSPALLPYIEHLRENRQKTTRYEIALWQKVLYPVAAIVMMVLAIPFAIRPPRDVLGRRAHPPTDIR